MLRALSANAQGEKRARLALRRQTEVVCAPSPHCVPSPISPRPSPLRVAARRTRSPRPEKCPPNRMCVRGSSGNALACAQDEPRSRKQTEVVCAPSPQCVPSPACLASRFRPTPAHLGTGGFVYAHALSGDTRSRWRRARRSSSLLPRRRCALPGRMLPRSRRWRPADSPARPSDPWRPTSLSPRAGLRPRRKTVRLVRTARAPARRLPCPQSASSLRRRSWRAVRRCLFRVLPPAIWRARAARSDSLSGSVHRRNCWRGPRLWW